MRWLRRIRVLRERERIGREMDEEMRFHVEMEAEELRRTEGLSAAESRRRALLVFGGVEQYRERGRETRGIAWLEGTTLDFRLGLRMLRKHAALTIIGGLGLAIAIAIAAGFFTFTTSFYYSRLPLDEGDRIVALENENLTDSEDWRATAFDLHTWRERLRGVEEISAFRRSTRVLEVPNGFAGAVPVAEMTASGFRVARVPPLLGRPLLDTDETAGAAPVMVIGHAEWQRMFGGAPNVIGRQVRLGERQYEVVGVMPEGFRFPHNHGFWTALAVNHTPLGPGEGPRVYVFGRLAGGVTKEAAQAELTAVGRQQSNDNPAVYRHLRPAILPYIHPLLDIQQYPAWLMWLMQLFAILLMSVVAVNVAVLVYARTAARRAEITVRAALGARRSRIVTQLFLEALVLSLFAAALGLLIAHAGYRQLIAIAGMDTHLPYWIPRGLSLSAIPYAAGLAVLAAVLVGVVPGLQATGRNLQSTLRRMGGAGELQLGRTWTVLIVVQVAIAVALLPSVVAIAAKAIWKPVPEANFAAPELLSVRITQGPDDAAGQPPEVAEAYAARQAELIRRLEALPGAADVTFALARPVTVERTSIEFDDVAATASPHVVRTRLVDASYLDVLGVPLLAGRSFTPGDASAGATSVIVSRAFVHELLGGGNALGRRFRRIVAEGSGEGAQTSYEIVGVAEDLYTLHGAAAGAEPVMYRAGAQGAEPLGIVLRTRGAPPGELVPAVRAVLRQVAPGWQASIAPMSELNGRLDPGTIRFLAAVVALITLSVLLLSAAGISALMSFAVSRRRREIGIRSALGASRGRLIASIFARSAGQIALGTAIGGAAAAGLDVASGGEMLGGRLGVLLPLVSLLMAIAGLLAAWRPARRALGVHPMEALRQE